MNFETLGNQVENASIFRGSEQKPFLAPRGVYASGNQLFVSDTGQNRVFIWKQLPSQEFQEPDVVLGQSEVSDSGRNAGGEVSAQTLQYPSGIWSNGEKLIVADAWNHRVLIWNSLPTENAQAADVVLGQPNFESNQPNVKGLSENPSAQSLYWCYGVFSDGKSLWIADTGNRRVLFYENIPTESYQAADKVIGKPDFQTRDYHNYEPIWPYSVKISPKGEMLITDTQFYRALYWKDWQTALEKPADFIIGQEDFDAAGQNQFGLFPSQKSLNWCYDAGFYQDGILVNDTGNSRVLYFEDIQENNPLAKFVIGKRDFKTGSENKDTMLGTDSSLYWQFSICVQNQKLFIADTGNHRLVMADLKF